MRYIPATAYVKKRIEEPFRIDQGFNSGRMGIGLKMINNVLGAFECRLKLFEDSSVGTEKIEKRYGKDQQQSGNETNGKENNFNIAHQFFIMGKTVSFYRIKNKKGNRYGAVVNAIF